MISDPHKTKYIVIKGKKVPVWAYGKKSNPPILFIHGYFNSFSEYIGDLPPRYLMKNYYVIAFDLPGFGLSKNLNLSPIKFINQIQKIILNNEKTNLFGISYGGLIALKYASKNSSRVEKIIIAGTPVLSGIFSLFKFSYLLPKYKGKKIQKKIIKEFDFLNSDKLSEISNQVLLLYSYSDYISNPFMGYKLKRSLNNSSIYFTRHLNHNWLLHKIDKSGFLNQIENFLNKK